MDEKVLEVEEKSISTPERRASCMSIEDPPTPRSVSSDGTISDHDEEDAESTYRDINLRPQISRASSTNAIGGVLTGLDRTFTGKSSGGASDLAFEVDFESEDENPQNWPLWYRCLILFIMSYSTTTVVLTSTSFTSAIPGLEKSFGITNSEGILGMTTYLIGIAVGSVILAPLSEMYGRRPIYVVSLALFVVFVVACAVAQDIVTILVIRFFGAFCASAMISNAPGSVNDIVPEKYRALAFSVWSIGPMNGT